MIETVGVKFVNDDTVYYLDINGVEPKKNLTVIAVLDKNNLFGTIVTDIKLIDKKNVAGVINRISTKNDYQKFLKNQKDGLEALSKSREIAKRLDLKMNIIDASFTLDRGQLVFHFYADNRIDFRELAHDLASIYKTRIELRQIGVRDKAKKIGGYGVCGQQLCCSRFINHFDSVSISMAKNQNISLNPNKINGICGRLLCCLKYENEYYVECKKCMPKKGAVIKTEHGEGRVVDIDLLNRKYVVQVPGVGLVEESACGKN